MDDRHSIHRMKNGDIGGLETLVRRYQVKAVRAAFFVTHDRALSEDIVQDTFIRLFQRIRQFDDTRPFEPYLMRSVLNASLNAIRQDHMAIPLDDDPARLEVLLDQAASVEAQVESRQLATEVMQSLARLTPRQRAVIVQRYYLELSEQEMARELGAAPGTIKWLLHQARTRLRELLRSGRSME
jgi:RNA polymerase sigma-70 factor (ECF subfamily)